VVGWLVGGLIWCWTRGVSLGGVCWLVGSVGAAVAGGPRSCCSAAQPEPVNAVERGDEVGCPGQVAATWQVVCRLLVLIRAAVWNKQ